MRVAIVGSRDYPDLAEVRRYVGTLPPDTVVVTGGARGVDRVAADEAESRGLAVVIHCAKWDDEGRSAGYRRNIRIVEDCDRVVAFWDGGSRGTQHTIDIARRKGRPVEVITGGRDG